MNKKYIVILAVLAVCIFALGTHLANAGPVEIRIGETTLSFLPLVIQSKAATGDVYIPAGTFQMGCYDPFTEDQTINCASNELPLHQVFLDAYYIDKYEVTNAQYKDCVTDGTCSLPDLTTRYNDPNYADHPVVYVDWSQAQDYCIWTGKRLPTEAEWERAARGDGYPRTYPWGEASPDVRWVNFGSIVGDTTWVGNYPAGVSPYGVHDMAGSVWEWVLDWMDFSYYSSSPASNPQGPLSGEYRVLRGGSWDGNGNYLRVAFRNFSYPVDSYNSLGFRCARGTSP